MSTGRFMPNGLTWKSGALALVLIMAGIGAVAALVGRAQPTYPVTATVLESRVVGEEPLCSWAVEIGLRNDSERRLRLYSVEMVGVEDSTQSLFGGFEPAESIDRLYEYPLRDCSAPTDAELTVHYGPALSQLMRSVTLTIE
ncbi:MAG: hypothetical protein GY698_20010 [Actinomycetia bacterium]|nr:hypothetical protein [Actinomycetes bacterium]